MFRLRLQCRHGFERVIESSTMPAVLRLPIAAGGPVLGLELLWPWARDTLRALECRDLQLRYDRALEAESGADALYREIEEDVAEVRAREDRVREVHAALKRGDGVGAHGLLQLYAHRFGIL